MKPLVTIPKKSQFIGSPCEPEIHGHSRSFSYQAYNLMHNVITRSPQIYGLSRPVKKNSQKNSNNSVPSFGTIKRPLTDSNKPIHDLLNNSSSILTQTVRISSRLLHLVFQKLYQFGPKVWDRSNCHSRPQPTEALT